MNDPRDWFREHGIRLFPLKAGTKEPACRWSVPYNGPVGRDYGVVLGASSVHAGEYLIVNDTDSPDAETWAAASLPATPFVVSTGRGKHRYFRALEPPATKFIRRDGLTIELKSGGQYVVGPGSLHPSGVEYRVSDWSWSWIDLPLFPNEFLIGERPITRTAGDRFEFPDEARAGERHDVLFRLIRSCKAQGVDISSTRQRVSLLNAGCCKPSLREDREFEQWFNRAWNLTDRPLVRAAEVDPFEDAL